MLAIMMMMMLAITMMMYGVFAEERISQEDWRDHCDLCDDDDDGMDEDDVDVGNDNDIDDFAPPGE